MATNFCLVKQNLASLSDVANTADPSTVSGRVTFTPVLGDKYAEGGGDRDELIKAVGDSE